MNANEILQTIYEIASESQESFIEDLDMRSLISDVCQCSNNRALTRLLLACTLAKTENPHYNACMPYTEIGETGRFSGRVYDEKYITSLIAQYQLPCNDTTAFLTPALRNIVQPLSSTITMAGNNKEMYRKAVLILESIENGKVPAILVLKELVRLLVIMRNEKRKRLDSFINELATRDDSLHPSSEAIFDLIAQHLQCKKSSRLPVLIVYAIYRTIGLHIGEDVLPLNAHNAADLQTKALGDIEVCLSEKEDSIVTVYEMKKRRVSVNDIDIAVNKIANSKYRIHNYIFITTDTIDSVVSDYARQIYDRTGGTEIIVLDCLGFLKYFLHFFHRHRMSFLNEYQQCVLGEPESAVRQELKEAFLVLRKVLESGN